MTTRALFAAVVVFVGLAVCLIFWPQERSAEDEVRATLTGMALAAEEGDARGVLEPISSAYRDEDGLDREALRALLARRFLSRGPILIVLGPIDVEIEGDEAFASFEAFFAEAYPDLGLGTEAQHFEVSLRLEEEGWRVIEHRREGLVP